MVDDSIYARLTGFAPLQNLVANNVFKTSVPPDMGPSTVNEEWSAVLFKRIYDDPFVNLDGNVARDWAAYEIRAISNVSSRRAREIYDQIRAAFRGYSGGEIKFAKLAGGGEDEDPDLNTRTFEIPAIFHIAY